MNTLSYVRPMNTRELFSSAFILYKKYFWKIFAINLVQTFTVFLIWNFSIVAGFIGGAFSSSTGNYWFLGSSIFISYISSIIGIFVGAAMLIAVSNAVLGRPVKIRNSYYRAWSLQLLWKMFVISIPPSLIVSLIISVPILVIMLTGSLLPLCFLPFGIVIMMVVITALVFIYPVVILEKRGIVKTVSRSFSLFWGNALRIFLNFFLWYIPAYIISLIFYYIVDIPTLILISPMVTGGFQEGFIVGTIVSFIIVGFTNFISGMFLAPFGTLLSILLYYDTRARRENYNETLLAEEMGYEVIGEMI